MKTNGTIEIYRPRFQLPAIAGSIERRILVNFRCRPEALARILPAPFRPKLINGWGMAGICLIRLGGMRPAFLPVLPGLKSENAAHRIAVEWNEGSTIREGVYIPRRDTNAWFNHVLGGRLFPGVHHAAQFRVRETTDRFELDMRSRDGITFVRVHARPTSQLPADSLFDSLDEASKFFCAGALGWSARSNKGEFEGLELHCPEWRMEPLALDLVKSSFFENPDLFPAGAIRLDSAFLMRNIAHRWHARGRMLTSPALPPRQVSELP